MNYILGFFVSSIFEYVKTATYAVIGSFFITFFMSGTIWPLEGMSLMLKKVAYYLPTTKSTEALRSILHRGWTFDNPIVYEGFIATCIWIFIFFSSSILIMKLKKN